MKERSAPFVGVIVLNHNGVTHLKEIFSSLARMDYVNAEISMVDNASSDDSVSLVRKNFPNVHIIQNRGNEHFAKGMNLGMQLFLHKNADYLALLNNDIEVDQRWLSELVSIAESDPAIGAVASRMMYYHNRKII
ncbi:MAG: glycosyltransferase, partial [Candidatus Saganbacteria bacterium]|nr:glycosyltransferase [Candidatus Saganbacteria bacterium]